MREIAVASIVIITCLAFLYVIGLLSFQGLCGFKSGHLAGQGKEWECSCIGRIDDVSSGYSEKQYCTGVNLSYNRLMGFFSMGLQQPVYEPENL